MAPGKEEGYMSSGVTILADWADCISLPAERETQRQSPEMHCNTDILIISARQINYETGGARALTAANYEDLEKNISDIPPKHRWGRSDTALLSRLPM